MFFTLAGGLKPSKQTSHWGSPFQIWMKIKRFWNPASNFGLGVSYITYITSLFVNNPYEQNNDVLGTLQNLQRSHIGSMGTVEVGDPRGVAMRDFSLAGPNIANCATCPDHSPSALDRPRTTHLKVTFLQYCVPSQFQTGRFLDIWSLRPAPKMLLQGAQNFLSSWVRVQYLQIHMCPMCISKKELYPLKLRFWATLSTFTFVASCCTPDSRLAATFSPHLWHLDAHCEQSSLLCPSKIWPQDATGRTLEIADDSRILNIHRILVSIHLWSVSVYLPWTSCSGCKEPTCKSHVCALTKIGIEFPDVSCRLWIRGFVLLAAFDKATFPGNWRTMRRPHLFLTAIMQKK